MSKNGAVDIVGELATDITEEKLLQICNVYNLIAEFFHLNFEDRNPSENNDSECNNLK